MGSISKSFSLFLIILLAVSFLMAKPTFAQIPTPSTIPTPSVPQFTVQLDGPPFIQNTTYSLNNNTGKIEPDTGYANKYSELVIVVQNQQFDSLYGSIYYNVTMNGMSFVRDGDSFVPYLEQTAGSDTTNITFSIFGGSGYGSIVGQQVSIQVQALLGSDQWGQTWAVPMGSYFFSGTHSDLSNPQIISVPANVPLTPSPSPTPTSSSPIFIVIAILIAVVIALVLWHRKTSNLSKQTFSHG